MGYIDLHPREPGGAGLGPVGSCHCGPCRASRLGENSSSFGELRAVAPRRLAARCYELRVTVPRTYAELEARVERWIATCVQSRTMVGGRQARRERELVRGNPTLRQVWERIRDAAGQTLTIRAEYIWGPNRVESIRFSAPIGVYNFEPMTITAGPADTVTRIVTRGLQLLPDASRHGVQLSPHQRRRIQCWLGMLRQAGADDRFLTAQSMLDYKNRNGSTPMTFSNVRQWLLPAFNIRRRIVATDTDILRSLKRIDELIIDGRQWINREFATQGIAVHRTVQQMRAWLDARERDAKSVYHCYCIDSGRC